MPTKNIKIWAVILLVIVATYWFTITRLDGTALNAEIQKEIESRIPVCQKRDMVGKAIKEIEPGIYYSSDLENYDKKAEACFNAVVNELNKK